MIFVDNYKELYTIDFQANKSKYICPACSTERKKKRDKSLYINRKTLIGKCYNCERSFFLKPEVDNVVKEWKQPKELKTPLTDKIIAYFKERRISESSLNYMKITCSDIVFPQSEDKKVRSSIDFNYYKSDKLVNIKHRSSDKMFLMETDCEICFYNYDAIYNYKKIVIVEGEIDALSFIESGIYNVISLPNGCNNIKFINYYIFDIEQVDEWVLCLDKDNGGIAARTELIGKLGIEKCSLINTKDCKDANAFLKKYGKQKLNDIYEQAEKLIDAENDVDINAMLDNAKIDNNTELKPYRIIFGEHRDGRDIEILSSGNTSLLVGAAKSKKTYALMVIVKLILVPIENYISYFNNGIVIFDTEQKDHHTKRFYNRLCKIVTDSDSVPKFTLYNLRGYNKEQRLKFIKWYIETYKPTLAIIDNIRDIIRNFNDIEQSDELATMLNNLSENTETHILSTLHVNKADKNARGHIGAELTQKAESVFITENDDDGETTISPAYARNEKFSPIPFIIENGIPVITYVGKELAGQRKKYNKDDEEKLPF